MIFCIPQRFDTMEEMQQHRTKHLTENKFKCEICSKEFPSHSSMWKHTKAHTGERKKMINGCVRPVDAEIVVLFCLLQVHLSARFVTRASHN